MARVRWHWLGWLGLLAIAGCDDDPAPTRPTPAPVVAPDPAPEDPPAAPAEDAPAPVARRTADAVRAARVELREARRASHEGDVAGAWTRFAALIEAQPRSPELRCEGGYVAYRAHELDAAREHLDAGLAMLGPPTAVPPALRRTAATCLYNRALVHEADGQTEEARRGYTDSLALRSNAVVRRRLEALPPREEAPPAVHVSPDVAELVSHLADFCEESPCEEGETGCEPTSSVLREDGGTAWLRLDCVGPDYGETSVEILVALPAPGGGFRVERVATGWTGGRYYSLAGVERIEPEPIVSLAGGAWRHAQLTFGTTFGYETLEVPADDGDGGSIECFASGQTLTTERSLVLCRDACRAVVIAHRAEVESSVDCSEDGRDVPTPAWAMPSEPEERPAPDYELSATFDADGARLHVVSGAAPDALRSFVDRPVPLDELFAAMTPLEAP